MQKFKVVRLDKDAELNVTHPLPGLRYDEYYIVLGEVANTNHYILASCSLKNPRILPGMYHLDDGRFIEVSDEEI